MRIVAAIDESDAGAHLLEVIGGWAAGSSVEVDLLHIVDPNKLQAMAWYGMPRQEQSPGSAWVSAATHVHEAPAVLPEDYSKAFERARIAVASRLGQLANAHLPGVQRSIHVELSPDPALVICDYAVQCGASAIAVGTRGQSPLRAALFGSVAEAVIRNSRVPVLVVRNDMPVPGAAS